MRPEVTLSGWASCRSQPSGDSLRARVSGRQVSKSGGIAPDLVPTRKPRPHPPCLRPWTLAPGRRQEGREGDAEVEQEGQLGAAVPSHSNAV